MRAPRLWTAAAALLLFAAALLTATLYARRVVAAHIHALAPQMFAQKNQGGVLQRAAFQQADLLPLYGSSELMVANPMHASAVFRDYPTGFTVFPVGSAGATSLLWLQSLAAVGSDLRGRKVVVSLSPRSFLEAPLDPPAYAANFSLLHAAALAFTPRLSFGLKQAVARRMLLYPATLDHAPLVRAALERLADGSWTSRVLYFAMLPLGQLATLVLRLQDDWDALAFVRAQPALPPPQHRDAAIDWNTRLRRTAETTQAAAGANAFHFANEFWAQHAADIAVLRGRYAAEPTQRLLQESPQWTDLELLLRTIRELGGEPLVIGTPMNGVYYDYLGIPSSARQAYYLRLRELTAAQQTPLVDFAEHDGDPLFTADPNLHLSEVGWTYYARAIDAFFHDRVATGS